MTETDLRSEPAILLVDDTPANLSVLAGILKEKGYRIRMATSGRMALESVARSRPDLILLDVAMPEMDGFEVCRRLKENEEWRSIPMIFISAISDPEGKVRSFEAGGVDYITKPFHYAEVEARVQTHLKLAAYQRQLEAMVAEKVAELVEARDRVAQAERMGLLWVMAAGIAHEINQPLNSIKLISSGLVLSHTEGRVRAAEEYIEGLDEISRQSDRIRSIIEHLRSFIRNDHGEFRTCSLNAAVTQSLEVIGRRLQDHGIRVETRLQADLQDIHAVPTGLEEVLINLALNAMQALDTLDKEGKRIIIRTYAQEEVVLEVEDNGPGIDEELAAKIFEPFVSSRNGMENMGLGLTIVNRIVSACGGRIETVSTPGEGALFRVTFPFPERRFDR